MRCSYCFKEFKSERGLKCHITRTHRESHKPQETSKCFIDRLDHNILLYQIVPYMTTNDLEKFLPLLPELMSYDDFWIRKMKEENFYNFEREFPENPSPAEAFIKLSSGKCYHCRTRTNAVNYFYEFNLCRACQKSHDYYSCHTQKVAREVFCLSLKDLSGLTCYLTKNPHYSSASPMKLYLASDLEKAAIEKYGDVKKEREKRAASRRKRREKEEENRNQREDLLIDALEELGLSLRGDSSLCEEFIDGGLSMSANEVAEEMAFMKYLHDFTDYRKRVKAEVESLKEENEGYYPTGVWRMASDAIKSQFVKPETWPWLITLK